MPRPKWCCQSAVDHHAGRERVVGRGDPVGQRACGGRTSSRRAAASGLRRRRRREPRETPARPCRPSTCGLPRSSTNVSGALRPVSVTHEGLARRGPSLLELFELARELADSCSNRSWPEHSRALSSGSARRDRSAVAGFAACGAESDAALEAGPRPGDRQAEAADVLEVIQADRHPALPQLDRRRLSLAVAVNAVVLDDASCRRSISREPSSESSENVYSPSCGTLSTPSKTKPKAVVARARRKIEQAAGQLARRLRLEVVEVGQPVPVSR